MIEEEGRVLGVSAGRALVQTERSAACEGCGAKGACGTLGGGREARVWVEDPLGVAVGERVVVAVPEGTVVRAGFLVYIVPVLALVAGALTGNRIGPSLGLSPDLGAAGVGIAAMILAFVLVRLLGRKNAAGPRIARRA